MRDLKFKTDQFGNVIINNINEAALRDLIVIDADKKVIEMRVRIKTLNENISKKKSELQILYDDWKAAKTQNALAELSTAEVEMKRKAYFDAKEETERLMLEFEPLESALKVLDARYKEAIESAAKQSRENSLLRLKEIRETEGDSLTRALDLMSEICTLELATYEGKTHEQILKKEYHKHKFPTAINTLRFIIDAEFDLKEYHRNSAVV
jgi:hypothetical protein